jgi:hypothetical protein
MLPDPTDVMPTRKPATRPISDIQANDFMVGGFTAARSSIFFWKKRKVAIDAIAVDIAQMDQKTHAQVRTGGTAHGKSQHDFPAHRAFAKMHDAGADLREEVKESVRTNGTDRRYAQTEDKDREQKNAAPDSCHSDKGSNKQTDQAFNQQIHDNIGFRL